MLIYFRYSLQEVLSILAIMQSNLSNFDSILIHVPDNKPDKQLNVGHEILKVLSPICSLFFNTLHFLFLPKYVSSIA